MIILGKVRYCLKRFKVLQKQISLIKYLSSNELLHSIVVIMFCNVDDSLTAIGREKSGPKVINTVFMLNLA